MHWKNKITAFLIVTRNAGRCSLYTEVRWKHPSSPWTQRYSIGADVTTPLNAAKGAKVTTEILG